MKVFTSQILYRIKPICKNGASEIYIGLSEPAAVNAETGLLFFLIF